MNEALKQLQQQLADALLGQQAEATNPFPGYKMARVLVDRASGKDADVDPVPAADLIFRILSAK